MNAKEGTVTVSWSTITKVVGACITLGTLAACAKAVPGLVADMTAQKEKTAVLETKATYTDKRLDSMDDKLDRILYRLPRRDLPRRDQEPN